MVQPPPNPPPPDPDDEVVENPDAFEHTRQHDEAVHEEAGSVAGAAATGAGCLAFGLIPWFVGGLVLVLLLVLWALRGGCAGQ